MRAVVCTRYGPPEVLRFEADFPKPTPGDREVLIRVRGATVTAGDCEVRRFDLPTWIWLPLRIVVGIRRPRRPVLGMELSGEIESVGKDVTRFSSGDQVFCSTGLRFGAHAEYACVRADHAIAIKPAHVSHEDAATIPTGAINALHFLRGAKIQRGARVLINGACGTIGTYAVGLARHYGAEVTAVDSTDKLDVLRSLGANRVIDYTAGDFTRDGETYDVIFDVVGKIPVSRCLKSLNENGRLLIGNPRLSHMIRALWTSLTSSKRIDAGAAGETPEDLALLAELIGAGTLRCVIDRRYPLERMVEAHTYVESGAKRGHVAITLTPRPS